jgi:hypothetical protein
MHAEHTSIRAYVPKDIVAGVEAAEAWLGKRFPDCNIRRLRRDWGVLLCVESGSRTFGVGVETQALDYPGFVVGWLNRFDARNEFENPPELPVRLYITPMGGTRK